MPVSISTLSIDNANYGYVDLHQHVGEQLNTLPYSLRVVAENVLRHSNSADDLDKVLRRQGETVSLRPTRLVLQDMLGLPLLIDLMAMKSAVTQGGGDANKIDISLPVDLVLDHSMTIENWGDTQALDANESREFEINRERFEFMKACEARFANLRVMPPGAGIIHQINIEHFGRCVDEVAYGDQTLLVPDVNFGTDSHTTMINGLGILGWGIGGLEAEAIMFGETSAYNVPKVVGVELTGELPAGKTATDLALTLAEQLRKVGVVDCFVELYGEGYAKLSGENRATLANMAPEYGATCVYCPIDKNTLSYLRSTGRSEAHIAKVEAYTKAQGLWFDLNTKATFDKSISIDLNSIVSSVAGPAKPEQRISLTDVTECFNSDVNERVQVENQTFDIGHDDVVIAAITSCTNTANPRNMMTAGLVAQKAVALGLNKQPHVKASVAPGSRVVAKYLERSGLQTALDALGFNITAFACSTCNGMSGPLAADVEATIKAHDIKCTAVLSGNRNFPGRIHPLASKNLLASPGLVVAYALAGSTRINIATDAIAHTPEGKPVFLADLWPSEAEIDEAVNASVTAELFQSTYDNIASVSEEWNKLPNEATEYVWKPSTNITWPGYLDNIPATPESNQAIKGLRPLVILGDSITTDDISPAASIPQGSAAADFLLSRGVDKRDFNSYGTRRGSSDVVIRSTFSNIRLRNEMVGDKEGSWTKIMPEGTESRIFEAIETYQARQQPLLVIAGQLYGCGSSRDTAAKAPWLAGIRLVIAESFERIHRSNLVNMGIAPLQFPEGVNRHTLKLTGEETFDVVFNDALTKAELTVTRPNGEQVCVTLEVRMNNESERNTYRQGGLLHAAYRTFIQ